LKYPIEFIGIAHTCADVSLYRLDSARRKVFIVASFAPQTEHLPSAVIFGCSFTSAPQSPHFGIESPPPKILISDLVAFLRIKAILLSTGLFLALERFVSYLAVSRAFHMF
jgi:hypothetical protein